MIEEELENFTESQNWDALCHYAMMTGKQATLSEETDSGVTLVARTADPKLNPGAVELSESSSPFRKMLYRTTIQTLERLPYAARPVEGLSDDLTKPN